MTRLLILLTPVLLAADWPVSRGNAAATGIGETTIDGELQVAWEFKTKNAIEGTAAIVNGVVYFASTDKHVYAVSLDKGELIWKQSVASPVKASVGFKDGRVYVGTVDGIFFCLNAKDGKPIWQFNADQEIVSGCNFYGDNILFGSNDGNLYCLDKDNKLQWKFGIDQPINGSPSISGDLSFVAGCDEILHVIDLKTGKETGQLNIGGPAASTAAVNKQIAYVGTMSNQVLAIDLAKPAAPKELWRFEAKTRQQPFYSSAALTDSLVLIGSRDKRLYALDRKTGVAKWSLPTDGMIDGNPVVVGETVYFGNLDSDGWMYAVNLADGRVKQKLPLDSTVTASPAVGPNCLLVGTEKGTLYCLRGRDKK